MKLWYRIGADAIFLAHCVLVAIAMFGFLYPSIWYLYMTVLIATLISALTYGYCILSKWEFYLRKKIDPSEHYDFSFATYYTYKLTNQRINERLYTVLVVTYLVLAIGINIFFRFVYEVPGHDLIRFVA